MLLSVVVRDEALKDTLRRAIKQDSPSCEYRPRRAEGDVVL